MLIKALTIIFFALIGIWLLWSIPYINVIAGIAALALAVVHAVER